MKETKYDIYTDLGTLVKENVSKEEAIEYMSKGLTVHISVKRYACTA